MKKNYLVLSLLGALALSTGCGTSTTSSSALSSSESVTSEVSSSVVTSSTVTSSKIESSSSSASFSGEFGDAAAYITKSYSVSYILDGATNQIKYEDGNFYSSYLAQGFLRGENGEAFLYYVNEADSAYYSENGNQGSWSELVEPFAEFGATFTAAKWSLLEGDETNATFVTQDKSVIFAASVLTDNYEGTVTEVTATVVKGKMTKFTTFGADEAEITTATVRRVGSTYAAYQPVQLETLDPLLVGNWTILQGTMLGEAGNEIQVSETTLTAGAATYTYSEPVGDGFYRFVSELGQVVEIGRFNSNLYYYYYDSVDATEYLDRGVCGSYLSIFTMTAEYLGYYVEADSAGEFGSYVLNGAKGYVLYAVDEAANEITTMCIISVFPTVDALLNCADIGMGGDTELYNGCALGGYVFGTMIMSASTEGGDDLWYEVTAYCPSTFLPVDYSNYPAATEGQGALDYLVSFAASKGFTYENKDTVNGQHSADISRYLASYSKYGVTDIYVFVNAEGSYSMVFIFDDPAKAAQSFENVYENIAIVGAGYFQVIGLFYNAMETWAHTVA